MKVIRKRLSRKQRLRQPDEFLGLSARVMEYLQDHGREVSLAFGALVLGLAVAGVWLLLDQRWDRAAAEVYAEGLAAYHSPDASVLASTEQRIRVYQQGVEAFQRVLDEYSRSGVAPAALYYLGNSFAEMGKLEKAIAAYQQFLSSYPGEKRLRPLVTLRLGYAYLAQKDYHQAEETFAALGEIPQMGQDLAFYELAQVYQMTGDTDKVVNNLRRLLEETPQSPWAAEAQARLAGLEKKPESQPKP